MKKNHPRVSIVFPNYNGGNQPLECLESITNLIYPRKKIEVIVVDNHSTDGSLEKIKNLRQSRTKIKNAIQKLKIIENKENVGFANAINIGIKNAKGEYVFIGNDDIIFDKASIHQMVTYMQNHPKVGVLGGKIYQKDDGKKVISAGYTMSKWTGDIHISPQIERVGEPDWVQGCAMLVARKVFNKIGFLDTGFSLIYFEDFDLCLRAKKAGYKVTYLPTAIFWHGNTTTMNKDKQNKYYQWYKNKIRFCLKNLPLINMTTILSLQLFLIAPYRAVVLRDGRFIPFLKGLLWNVKHFSKTLSSRIQQ